MLFLSPALFPANEFGDMFLL